MTFEQWYSKEYGGETIAFRLRHMLKASWLSGYAQAINDTSSKRRIIPNDSKQLVLRHKDGTAL
jgi:hypothetical protein